MPRAPARPRAPGELGSTRLQKRYLRKDGATVWVDLTVALVRDAEGKPLYEIAVFDDDTERKQAEQALRDSAEKLRPVADNVPAMTVSWDENLRCRFANKVFTEFFGVAVEDIIGKHVREVIGGGGVPGDRRPFCASAAGTSGHLPKNPQASKR